MSELTLEQIREIAETVKSWDEEFYPINWNYYSDPAQYVFNGRPMPKERPRAGKGGRMYTPAETKKFEKAVKAWGKACGMKPVHYPIRASLTIYDLTLDDTKRIHSVGGLIYDGRGDLDNYEKAVFDGLNKIAYADDKQITNQPSNRVYSSTEGFSLILQRNGLSKMEYTRLLKVMRSLK